MTAVLRMFAGKHDIMQMNISLWPILMVFIIYLTYDLLMNEKNISRTFVPLNHFVLYYEQFELFFYSL